MFESFVKSFVMANSPPKGSPIKDSTVEKKGGAPMMYDEHYSSNNVHRNSPAKDGRGRGGRKEKKGNFYT